MVTRQQLKCKLDIFQKTLFWTLVSIKNLVAKTVQIAAEQCLRSDVTFFYQNGIIIGAPVYFWRKEQGKEIFQ